MKKRFYCLLAIVLAATLFTSPLLANTPFEDSKVSVGNTSNSDLETADISVTESSSNTNNTNSNSDEAKDYKTPVNGVITASALNVRSCPWGDVMGYYHKGDQVQIIGKLGDWYKVNYNGKECYIHQNWVTTPDHQGQTAIRYGVVNNSNGLNIYRTPSGDVISKLNGGDQVYILGEVGDWYKIKVNGNEAFVSKKYIDAPSAQLSASYSTIASNTNTSSSSGSNSNASTDNAVAANNGSLQQNIVTQARGLLGSTAFRTADVDYGNKACAKVATTALKNAGALDSVYLNCRTTVAKLKEKGWVEVTPPPYQEGDVITWKTYDYTGDGIKDEDTHIGIIVKEGNTYKAMNNSSSMKTPRISEINIAPISRVLRKA